MDILSTVGIFLGVGMIILGNLVEGGHLGSLLNGPAAMIVLGGAIGAIMVQAPMPTFVLAIRMVPWVFKPPANRLKDTLTDILDWSRVARKEGLLGLENVISETKDTFAQKGLLLVVDGNEPDLIRETLDIDAEAFAHRHTEAAKLFEGLGGYCPTVGIIGAVLGLIHVMQNLADPSALGPGIATAFVATIYGVGLANLVFLPIGAKLKAVVQAQSQYHELITMGLVGIAQGENPKVIESRLQGMIH